MTCEHIYDGVPLTYPCKQTMQLLFRVVGKTFCNYVGTVNVILLVVCILMPTPRINISNDRKWLMYVHVIDSSQFNSITTIAWMCYKNYHVKTRTDSSV